MGLAIATRFGKEGYNVGLVARSQENLDTLKSQLAEAGVTSVKTVTGDVTNVGPFTVELENLGQEKGPNFTAAVAHTVLRRDGKVIATVEPQERFYPVRGMSRAEAGIITLGFGQFYESIAAPVNGRVDVKLFWKPLVTLIWIGAIVMAFGGVLSLSDRRLRFGIAARARRATPVAAIPAE